MTEVDSHSILNMTQTLVMVHFNPGESPETRRYKKHFFKNRNNRYNKRKSTSLTELNNQIEKMSNILKCKSTNHLTKQVNVLTSNKLTETKSLTTLLEHKQANCPASSLINIPGHFSLKYKTRNKENLDEICIISETGPPVTYQNTTRFHRPQDYTYINQVYYGTNSVLEIDKIENSFSDTSQTSLFGTLIVILFLLPFIVVFVFTSH